MQLAAKFSPILYHITPTAKLNAILNQGVFHLKPSDGNDSEEVLGGSTYYLSTARNPASEYIKQSAGRRYAVIQLDGTKLGQRYRIRPVDYFGGMSGRTGKSEQEDRVFSSKPTIPAIPYITAIHAVVSDNDVEMYALWRQVKLLNGKGHDIKLYWYDKAADLLHLKRQRSLVDFVPKRPGLEDRERLTKSAQERYNSKLKYGDGPGESYLRAWLNLYLIPVMNDDPSGTMRKIIQSTKNKALNNVHSMLQYPTDVTQLSSELHNAKSTPYGEVRKDRETLEQLIGIMRKLGVDYRGYFKLMRDKWYPPRNKV